MQDDLETHITSHSFVYSPFVDWYILLPVFLQRKNPVLYLGNAILDDYTAYAQDEYKSTKLEECNELGREFLEGRKRVGLKEFALHAHALNGMEVFWKHGDEEPEEEGKEELGKEGQ